MSTESEIVASVVRTMMPRAWDTQWREYQRPAVITEIVRWFATDTVFTGMVVKDERGDYFYYDRAKDSWTILSGLKPDWEKLIWIAGPRNYNADCSVCKEYWPHIGRPHESAEESSP